MGMARYSCVGILILCLVGAPGCRTAPEEEEKAIWEGVRIADLAPPPHDRLPRPRFLATVTIEVRALDLPADNIERLDDVWSILSANPIRMTSYNAFTENCFRIRYGRMDVWEQVQQMLSDAGAQGTSRTLLAVTDNDITDLPITNVPVGRRIAFVGTNLSKESVDVGPGILALRLRSEQIPWARGARKIIAYPVHTVSVAHTIPELAARARQREFYFAPAAFALQMAPGDFVLLAPDEYTGDRASLGGLFFNRPEGTMFFDPDKPKPPEHKPAVRVYILMCTRIGD